MTDDDTPLTADGFFFRQKCAAGCRLHAEHREEVGGHEESLHRFGLIPADEVGGPPLEGSQTFERATLLPEIEVVPWREGLAPVLIVARRKRNERDSIHVLHRERAQDERVEHRKDGCVGSQPHCKREDDDAAERRALQDGSNGIPRFESEGSHEGVSGRT
jgi:hypothetical protein